MRTFFYLAVIFLALSCNKNHDPAYDKNKKSEFTVEFDNVAGSADLELNASYQNVSGEEVTVESLNYIIRNIVLTASDGSTYSLPQGDVGFLIDESEEESTEISGEIPESEYKTLQFDVIFFEMDATSTASNSGTFSYTLQAATSGKTITLDLSARGTAKVITGQHSEVHLLVDVLDFFSGFSFADNPTLTTSDFNTIPASNLSRMFVHDHTHND